MSRRKLRRTSTIGKDRGISFCTIDAQPVPLGWRQDHYNNYMKTSAVLLVVLLVISTVMSTTAAAPKRVAIITGGTRGIGRGITQALAESGEYSGFLLSYNTNREAAEAFVKELCKQYKSLQVELVGGDISLSATRNEIFDCFDSKFDDEDCCLAVVVHNAGQYVGVTSDNAEGLSGGNLGFGDGSLLDDEKVNFDTMHYYQRMYGDAYIDLCERGLVRMRKAAEQQGEGKPYRGSLIGISSPGCNVMQRANPGYDMPGSGKCVMEYSMRLFAIRAAKLGINCNVIIPGATKTDAWTRIEKQRGVDEGQLFNQVVSRVPIAEEIDPKEIGDVVAFLSGYGGGRFITGLSLSVDGGLHLGSLPIGRPSAPK